MNNPVPPFLPGSFEAGSDNLIPDFMRGLTSPTPEFPQEGIPEELKRMGFRVLDPGTFVDLHTWNRIIEGQNSPINSNPIKLMAQLPVMNHIVTLENGRQLVEPSTLGLGLLSIGISTLNGLALERRIETMSLLEQLAQAFPELAQHLRSIDPDNFNANNFLIDVRPSINSGLLKK
jgi:hypothetical protein